MKILCLRPKVCRYWKSMAIRMNNEERFLELRRKEKNMGEKFKISNLDLYYGDFQALKNINMSIQEKEITAFIGPSGCGKSTFIKCLNRMNDLVEGCKITGEILLDGEDIYRGMDVNLLRRRVGMVFQKPNPFPMSIYDNIAYGPRTHGIRSKAKVPAGRCNLGRGEGPLEKKRDRDVRRAAAEALHRACACGRSGGYPYGRADFRA